MKKTILIGLGVFSAFAAGFMGCKKDEPAPVDPIDNTIQVGTIPGFTWTPAGGATIFADSSKCIGAFNNIIAYKKGNSNSVDIVLSSITVSTYSISSSLGNSFDFITAGTSYSGKSGTLSITANANGKLTGSFSTSLTGGTVTALTGEFINIPIK